MNENNTDLIISLKPDPEWEPGSLLFLFCHDNILVRLEAEQASFVTGKEFRYQDLIIHNILHIGIFDARSCVAGEIEDIALPEGYSFINLRQIFYHMEVEQAWIAGKAYHLLIWNKNTQYCGRCGSGNLVSADLVGKKCSHCGFITFPIIAPAIIVGVIKENELLLIQGIDFHSEQYGLIAGFVEIGESLEECVMREVYEETKISIKNLRYFDSQAWPFPNSFMIGFIAEYAAGEIALDKNELRAGDWFRYDDLPKVTDSISIAGRIIEWITGCLSQGLDPWEMGKKE
jgi:NAD+ diphosphatase